MGHGQIWWDKSRGSTYFFYSRDTVATLIQFAMDLVGAVQATAQIALWQFDFGLPTGLHSVAIRFKFGDDRRSHCHNFSLRMLALYSSHTVYGFGQLTDGLFARSQHAKLWPFRMGHTS